MANITRLTDNLFTGGDLPAGAPTRLEHLSDWLAAGVTHVIDNRLEWSDEDLVAAHAPGVVYLHNGIDDDGRRVPDWWFEDGVAFALDALARPGAVVLSHCHMGVNRGPSLALAILLAQDWDVIMAVELIRSQRPVAAIGYAHDALDWWHRRQSAATPKRRADRQRLLDWQHTNQIDVTGIIRTIRRDEPPG